MNNMISTEDINYLTQQPSGKIDMIISGMTALMNDTDSKVASMESQNWFQRMTKTVLGKNKATLNEIRENHDKLNTYMVEAIAELYNRNCVTYEVMMSLSTKLNELYENNIQIKQMLGAFVSKLNEKIESVDNFHILETEIEQDVYSPLSPIYAICKVISQMDKRTLQDSRKMDILKRSLTSKNIINDTEVPLVDYLMNIIEIPSDEIGKIYLELQTLRGNFIANIILNMIEKYYFLPDMARKLKNKQSLINEVIANEQLDSSVQLAINNIYDDFIETKINVLNNQVTIMLEEKNEPIEEDIIDNKEFKTTESTETSNWFRDMLNSISSGVNDTSDRNSEDKEDIYTSIYNKFRTLNFKYPEYISFYKESPNRIQKACGAFCDINLEKEKPIFCVDFSAFGTNAHGFLVSDKYFYCCNTWESSWYIPLDEIISFDETIGVFDDVMPISTYSTREGKNEVNFPMTQSLDIDKYRKLLNYIVDLIKY